VLKGMRWVDREVKRGFGRINDFWMIKVVCRSAEAINNGKYINYVEFSRKMCAMKIILIIIWYKMILLDSRMKLMMQ
jgi:hypothetical protein